MRRLIPILLLLLLCLGQIFLHYGKVMEEPGSWVFGGDADGLKNYYTPWYHVKHDSSLTWFQGMGYPWGDHVVYADAQPLLSNAVKLVHEHVTPIPDAMPAVMNLFMLLSVGLTAWLLYRIFLHLRMPVLDAVWAAVAIAFLSPQFSRITGHYALSYTFIFPLYWFLLLGYLESGRIGWSLGLLAATVLAGWLHPYYVMISALFLALVWAFQWLTRRQSLPWRWALPHFVIQVVLPVVLFRLSIAVGDTVTDRPALPGGMESYHANWKGLILPLSLPSQSWSIGLTKSVGLDDNGPSYLGLFAILCLVFFLGRTALRLWRSYRRGQGLSLWQRLRRVLRRLLRPSARPFLAISVLAGFGMMLLAFGIPFSWKPELMTQIFPPIKQFRSLGRFIWAFYYVWTVYAFYLLWQTSRLWRRKGWRIAAVSLRVVPVLFMLAEGWDFHRGLSFFVTSNRFSDLQHKQHLMHTPEIDPNQYQALLYLPFFHIGSENMSAVNDGVMGPALLTSLETGLPLIDQSMSRSSFSHTWDALRLVTEPYRKLDYPEYLRDERPVLTCIDHDNDSALYMMGFGRFPAVRPVPGIHGSDSTLLHPIPPYRLPLWFPLDLTSLHPPTAEQMLAQYGLTRDSLPQAGLRSFPAGAPFLHLDFEDGDAEGYLGSKGRRCPLKDNNWLWDAPLDFARPGDTLLLGLWSRCKGDRLPYSRIGITRNGPDGNARYYNYISVYNHLCVMDGEWGLHERRFYGGDPGDVYRINVTQWKRWPPEMVVDELLIRHAHTTVAGNVNGMLYLNGRFYLWESNR